MTLGDAIFSIFLICIMFCVMVISSIACAAFFAWAMDGSKGGSEMGLLFGAVVGFILPLGVFHIK